jgi:hypothetical protein
VVFGGVKGKEGEKTDSREMNGLLASLNKQL